MNLDHLIVNHFYGRIIQIGTNMSTTVNSILVDHSRGLDRTILMFLQPASVSQLENDLNQVSGPSIIPIYHIGLNEKTCTNF